MMNGHRLIISNIWKGLKLFPSNVALHATSSSSPDYTDFNDEQHSIGNHCTFIRRQLYNQCTSSSTAICSAQLYENTLGVNRSTFYPFYTHGQLDCNVLNRGAILNNTAEASVQTDALLPQLYTEKKNDDDGDSVIKAINNGNKSGDRIDEFKGFVDNLIGVQMADDKQGDRAIRKWIEAANCGSNDALYNLAMCFYYGVFVSQNIAKAISLWRKASRCGHAQSQYQLGVCYIRAIGVEMNNAKGIALIEQSAIKGYPKAQYFMALKLLNDGERIESINYLRQSIHNTNIRHLVKKWLSCNTLPADIRQIVSNSLRNSSLLI